MGFYMHTHNLKSNVIIVQILHVAVCTHCNMICSESPPTVGQIYFQTAITVVFNVMEESETSLRRRLTLRTTIDTIATL